MSVNLQKVHKLFALRVVSQCHDRLDAIQGDPVIIILFKQRPYFELDKFNLETRITVATKQQHAFVSSQKFISHYFAELCEEC